MPRAGSGTREPVPPFALGHVDVSPLAPGVYAAIRRDEPLGLAQNANSLFIVGDTDVIVVDAQFTREATLENLAALRRVTSKPVSIVINTHWHDDHVAGNQVYQDSFPGVRFVAQGNTREDLIEKGRPNRAQQVQFAPPVANRFARLLAMGLGGDSTPLSPLERRTLESSLRIFRTYLDENAAYRETLPDSLVDSELVVTRGDRRVVLRWFGRGNTRGDLVTWLPREGIVSTGDLVVWPIPFAFNSYPTEWLAVLDSVIALAPRLIVPGHGPVMRDLGYVRAEREMIAATRERALAALDAGTPTDSLAGAVPLEALRQCAAGEDKWIRVMCGNFRGALLARLVAERRSGTLP